MVQSTARIAAVEPEDARLFLDQVVCRLTESVHHYGGVVYRIAGDGILALFGAPVAYEDHAHRACLAGLHIQASIAERFPAQTGANPNPLRVRVGISTGNVLLRSISTDMHTEHTAEGATTHLAAKAERAAAPGTVVVTAEVAWLVAGLIEYLPLAPILLEGMQEPTQFYQLVDSLGAETRFQVSSQRGLSQLIGREPELSRLREFARAVADGAPKAILVEGDAGVGKSRLLWELLQELREQSWEIAQVRPTNFGARSSYFPIVAAIRQLYSIEMSDTPQQIAAKTSHAATIGESFNLSSLLVLLGKNVSVSDWDSVEAAAKRRLTERSLMALIAGISSRKSVLIIVEDFHETDVETKEFLADVVRHQKAGHLLLLLEARPTNERIAADKGRIELMRVEPLDSAQSTQLIRHLAGTDRSDPELEAAIVERLGGNPFFIEETIRLLFESGVLIRTAEGYRIRDKKTTIPIPASAKNVLEARIANLVRTDRDVLQHAAVIGKVFPIRLLEMLTHLPQDELTHRIGRLRHSGLITVEITYHGGSCSFAHSFIQEVAYEGLGKSDRLGAHRSLVAHFESVSDLEAPERVELVAHHALQGGDSPRAIRYLRMSSERATERGAFRQAVHQLDQALSVLPRIDSRDGGIDTEIELRLALRPPLLALGNLPRTSEEVAKLEAMSPQCSRDELKAQLAVLVCSHRLFTGDVVGAVATGRMAIAIGQHSNDLTVLVPTRQFVGNALHYMGAFSEAKAELTRNIEALSGSLIRDHFGMAGAASVFARSSRAWVCEHTGEFEAAWQDIDAALQICKTLDHGFTKLSALHNASSLAIAMGDFATALPLLAEAMEICQREKQHLWTSMIGPLLVQALTETGNALEARKLLERIAPPASGRVVSSHVGLSLAEAFAVLDDTAIARQIAHAVLERTRSSGERVWQALVLLLLAHMSSRLPQPNDTEARKAYAESAEVASSLGMRPLLAKAQLGLAELDLRAGLRDAAHFKLVQAVSEFSALKLEFWRQKALQLQDAVN
jgi:predicted ATPase/class 3 adenylate cyclase